MSTTTRINRRVPGSWPAGRVLICSLMGCLLLAGCGSSGPEVCRVSGTLVRAGKPVPHATVIFQPEQGRPSQGITNEAGQFSLRYTKDRDGAVAGKHRVYLLFEPPAGPEAELARAAGKSVAHPEQQQLAAQYGPDQSPLTVEVTEDGQEVTLKLD